MGFIIKTLEQRFGLIGQWIMKLIGAVWSVACDFVIPVIITEEETSNPVTMLKKSALTLTRTWGESLIGYVGVRLGGTLILVSCLVWGAAAMAATMVFHSTWLAVILCLTWLVTFFTLSYLMSVASQIFRCALFLYATEGTLPAPYTDEMAAMAWKVKNPDSVRKRRGTRTKSALPRSARSVLDCGSPLPLFPEPPKPSETPVQPTQPPARATHIIAARETTHPASKSCSSSQLSASASSSSPPSML